MEPLPPGSETSTPGELESLYTSRKSVSNKINSSVKKYRDDELDIALEDDEGIEDVEPSSPRDTPLKPKLSLKKSNSSSGVFDS